MKVMMLNPPFLPRYSRPQRSPAVTKSGTVYYPNWLASATGVLLDAGFDAVLIDSPADNIGRQDTLNRVADYGPEVVVLETSTPSIYNDLDFAAEVKAILPKARIGLVGTHVSALAEETMEQGKAVDFVCRREFDDTVRDVAERLAGDESLDSVPGVTWRKDGRIVSNPDRDPIEDLDRLPFVSAVYKRFLNIRNYFNPNALYPMVTIVSGRGCPFRCVFCVYPQTMMGRRYRLRSVPNVVEEMAYIRSEFPKARAVFFEDDTLTVNRRRCVELSEEMLRRNVKISWTANARADLDYETMAVMKRAGCRCLCVGFESGDADVLRGMHKGITVDKMMRFRDDARRAGVLIHGCFMVGNPGETRDSLARTLDLALRLDPDTAQFYPLMVYPGTEGYDWAKREGYLITEDYSRWLTEEGLHAGVVSTPELSAQEMEQFCDMARRRFYLRPRYMARKLIQAVRTPAEGIRIVKAGWTFWKHLWKGTRRSSPQSSS